MDHLVADEERVRWARDGFVALDRPLIDERARRELARLLDPLLERWSELPAPHAQDLAGAYAGASIREITLASRLEPRLRRTAAYTAMRDLAAALLDRRVVRAHFDHVVAKGPGAPMTSWHQDIAFDPGSDVPMATVWLPLVDVDPASGAMQYLAGTHVGPVLAHEPTGRHGLQAHGVDDAGAITCVVPAGGCTVHMARTLHASTPNTGADTRVAWIVKFVADDRPPVRRAIGDRRARRRPVECRTT